MLHENRNVIVYGGGGAIGGAVARAFARAGSDLAVFLASDKASGMTGTIVNLSMGAIAD